jgi:hypothetical protein
MEKSHRWSSIHAPRTFNFQLWTSESKTIEGHRGCRTSIANLWIFYGFIDYDPSDPNMQWSQWGVKWQIHKWFVNLYFKKKEHNKGPRVFSISDNKLWTPETGWIQQ